MLIIWLIYEFVLALTAMPHDVQSIDDMICDEFDLELKPLFGWYTFAHQKNKGDPEFSRKCVRLCLKLQYNCQYCDSKCVSEFNSNIIANIIMYWRTHLGNRTTTHTHTQTRIRLITLPIQACRRTNVIPLQHTVNTALGTEFWYRSTSWRSRPTRWSVLLILHLLWGNVE